MTLPAAAADGMSVMVATMTSVASTMSPAAQVSQTMPMPVATVVAKGKMVT